MDIRIERKSYLDQLAMRREAEMIKAVTGDLDGIHQINLIDWLKPSHQE